MAKIMRQRFTNILYYTLTILVTLVAYISLLRIIKAEFYILALVVYIMLIAICYVEKSYNRFLTTVIIVTLIISLSWPLASHFTNLPRGDIYHYYPFTRYIYKYGSFKGATEKVFGVYVPHWPIWHIDIAVLSHISGIDLFYIAQIYNVFTLALLAPIIILLFINHIDLKFINFKEIRYIALILFAFNNFTVYMYTTPAPRSSAYVLSFIAIYLVLKLATSYSIKAVLPVAILLTALIFLHPFNATFFLSTLVIFGMLLMIPMRIKYMKILSIKLKIYIQNVSLKNILIIASSGLLFNICWLLYNALTIVHQSSGYIKNIFNIKTANTVSRYVARLSLPSIQRELFKMHPLEPYISKAIWTADILILTLAIAGFIVFYFLILKDRVGNKLGSIPLVYITISLFLIFLIDLFITKMDPYRVFLFSIPLISLFASIPIILISNLNFRKILFLGMIILYISTAALSLGTIAYQASFIWSSKITFEDKGLLTTHGIPVMSFINKYGDFNSYEHVLADDPIVKILVKNFDYYISYVKGHKGFPEDVTLIYSEHVHNTLAIDLRNFKPLYGILRKTISGAVNIKNINIAQAELKKYISSKNLVYNNNLTHVYFIF